MSCRILSIVPYQILPANTGGRQGIAVMQHYIGQVCEVHMVSTTSNVAEHQFAFHLHRIMPAGKQRYLPYYNSSALTALARKHEVTAIYCDHPYMAFTANRLARKLGLRWYMRSHNIESERFRSLGKKWWPLMFVLERYAMRHADGIFFVTPEDRDVAIARYHIAHDKCHIAPFGTPLERPPQGHDAAKALLGKDLSLDASKPFLYFVGVLDYAPNAQAVEFIADQVLPRLKARGADCEIVIAGKGLPDAIQAKIARTGNIRYAGFVPDLETFLKGCDIMLNPVQSGGGIKTKVVEALAYNKIVVSTQTGAAGLLPQVCGTNLAISNDNDWDAFTDNVVAAMRRQPEIPVAFYDRYYWGNIAQMIKDIMSR